GATEDDANQSRDGCARLVGDGRTVGEIDAFRAAADGPAGMIGQGRYSAKNGGAGTRRIRHRDATEIFDRCGSGRPGGEDAVRDPLYLRARVVGHGSAVPD